MAILFKTELFIVREMIDSDIDGFFDLQSNKKGMDMVPDKTMTFEESKKDLKIRIDNYKSKINTFDVWAVINKNTTNFIGTCALIYDTTISVEIGYRFREKYWGKGVATEITKGLVDYIFTQTNYQSITADVSKKNIGSTKVLQKFFTQVNEGFNEKDNCYDLNFELKKIDFNKL